MIEIKRSSEADSRTATHQVSEAELLKNSEQHISDVKAALAWFRDNLLMVGMKHDWTKVEYIKEFYRDFADSQEGFQGDFKQQHWFKDLHLQERHHLNDRCPDNVNMFDVLERIADITMAGLARSGQIYDAEIDPDILVKAYQNTIKLLSDNTKVLT